MYGIVCRCRWSRAQDLHPYHSDGEWCAILYTPLVHVSLTTECLFADVSDECFVVERYESDVEEGDEDGDQILLTLSDRFLEEKDTNGVVRDTSSLGLAACLPPVNVYVM